MANFKTWTNPSNKEIRIYVDGLPNQKGSKVFVCACPADAFGFEYDIQARIPEGVYANRSDLVNAAEEAIFSTLGFRAKKFSEVQTLAK